MIKFVCSILLAFLAVQSQTEAFKFIPVAVQPVVAAPVVTPVATPIVINSNKLYMLGQKVGALSTFLQTLINAKYARKATIVAAVPVAAVPIYSKSKTISYGSVYPVAAVPAAVAVPAVVASSSTTTTTNTAAAPASAPAPPGSGQYLPAEGGASDDAGSTDDDDTSARRYRSARRHRTRVAKH